MPASFAADLCGYRPKTGAPSTSDANDPLSVELGHELFSQLGVPATQPEGRDPGARLELSVQSDLARLRPDLVIARSRSVVEFEQYQHLAVFPRYKRVYRQIAPQLQKLHELAESLPPSPSAARLQKALLRSASQFAEQDLLASRLFSEMPEESFLKVDITVGANDATPSPMMHIGLSSKWSLRTDRAQDCVSQGAKLASQRRGPMPHFAVITMEPRPAMLRILGDGSGAIDCVYHLNLPALERAITAVARRKPTKWSPKVTFDRLIQQGRLRDYDDLIQSLRRAPESD